MRTTSLQYKPRHAIDLDEVGVPWCTCGSEILQGWDRTPRGYALSQICFESGVTLSRRVIPEQETVSA